MTTGTIRDILVGAIGLWFVKNHACVVIYVLQAPLSFETYEKQTFVSMNRFYEWNYRKY